jgi:hypothetical protein
MDSAGPFANRKCVNDFVRRTVDDRNIAGPFVADEDKEISARLCVNNSADEKGGQTDRAER